MVDKERIIEKLEVGVSSERIMGKHGVTPRKLTAIRKSYYKEHGKSNSVRAYELIDKGLSTDEIAKDTVLSKGSISAYRACYTMQNRPGGKHGGRMTGRARGKVADWDNYDVYDDLMKGLSDDEMLEKYDGLDSRSLGAYKANLTRKIDK